MTGTFLMISSKNYSSWSLRGWLLCRMAGLDFVEEVVPADDPAFQGDGQAATGGAGAWLAGGRLPKPWGRVRT